MKGKNCLIVDDFTISGGTLVNLANGLKERGALDIIAMLSHNIISAHGVQRINSSPIQTVYSTVRVFNPNIIGQEKFKTVSVAPMFAETIMRYYQHNSVNQMFSQLPEHVIEAGLKLANLNL